MVNRRQNQQLMFPGGYFDIREGVRAPLDLDNFSPLKIAQFLRWIQSPISFFWYKGKDPVYFLNGAVIELEEFKGAVKEETHYRDRVSELIAESPEKYVNSLAVGTLRSAYRLLKDSPDSFARKEDDSFAERTDRLRDLEKYAENPDQRRWFPEEIDRWPTLRNYSKLIRDIEGNPRLNITHMIMLGDFLDGQVFSVRSIDRIYSKHHNSFLSPKRFAEESRDNRNINILDKKDPYLIGLPIMAKPSLFYKEMFEDLQKIKEGIKK